MIDALAALPPTTTFALVIVVGLCVGSFLNVVIHRLPLMMQRQWHAEARDVLALDPIEPDEPFDLSRPRSRCPDCGHAISAIENIPVLSWLALRGRCRGCARPISVRYPVVELVAACIGVGVFHVYGSGTAAIAGTGFAWALLALACIDYDTQYLPDEITLPLLWAGLLVNVAGTFVSLTDAVIGAASGYLALWSVYHAFRLLTGKEGMGYGDFKLLAAIGAWLGWQQLPLVVIASSAIGAIVGIGLIVIRRHERGVPIPFGPFLAAAGFVALVAGDELTGWYLGALQ